MRGRQGENVLAAFITLYGFQRRVMRLWKVKAEKLHKAQSTKSRSALRALRISGGRDGCGHSATA